MLGNDQGGRVVKPMEHTFTWEITSSISCFCYGMHWAGIGVTWAGNRVTGASIGTWHWSDWNLHWSNPQVFFRISVVYCLFCFPRSSLLSMHLSTLFCLPIFLILPNSWSSCFSAPIFLSFSYSLPPPSIVPVMMIHCPNPGCLHNVRSSWKPFKNKAGLSIHLSKIPWL